MRPPRKVGLVANDPDPTWLPPVGASVVLSDGRYGKVAEYEYYHWTQTRFPILVDGRTIVRMLDEVTVVDHDTTPGLRPAVLGLDAARRTRRRTTTDRAVS